MRDSGPSGGVGRRTASRFWNPPVAIGVILVIVVSVLAFGALAQWWFILGQPPWNGLAGQFTAGETTAVAGIGARAAFLSALFAFGTFVSALGAAIAAICYAVLTNRIATSGEASLRELALQRDEMRRLREDSLRPAVVVEVHDPRSGFADPAVVVHNVGPGPALNIGMQIVLHEAATCSNTKACAQEDRTLVGLEGGRRRDDHQGFNIVSAKLKPELDHGARAWVLVWYDDVFQNHWRTVVPLWWDRAGEQLNDHSRIIQIGGTFLGVTGHDQPWVLDDEQVDLNELQRLARLRTQHSLHR